MKHYEVLILDKANEDMEAIYIRRLFFRVNDLGQKCILHPFKLTFAAILCILVYEVIGYVKYTFKRYAHTG